MQHRPLDAAVWYGRPAMPYLPQQSADGKPNNQQPNHHVSRAPHF